MYSLTYRDDDDDDDDWGRYMRCIRTDTRDDDGRGVVMQYTVRWGISIQERTICKKHVRKERS